MFAAVIEDKSTLILLNESPVFVSKQPFALIEPAQIVVLVPVIIKLVQVVPSVVY